MKTILSRTEGIKRLVRGDATYQLFWPFTPHPPTDPSGRGYVSHHRAWWDSYSEFAQRLFR